MAELKILGSNSALPAQGRHPSAQLLTVHQEFFLIDCGEGTQMQLSKFGVRRSKISHIFISHLHGDHIYGLPGLITSYNHFGRTKPLYLFGPIGIKDFIEKTVFITGNPLNFDFHVEEFDPDEYNVLLDTPWVHVETVTLTHRIPTAGFIFSIKNPRLKVRLDALEAHGIKGADRSRIQAGEDFVTDTGEVIKNESLTWPPSKPLRYAYFSDTMFVPELAERIQEVDCLYHEATFLTALQEKAVQTKHSTAAEAAKMAKLAHAKKLIIGHFSSRYDKLDEFLTESRIIFPNTKLAVEGKDYRIGED